MPCKAPPHPGLGLHDDIESLGLSVAEVAEGLGVTRQQLYGVIGGNSAIAPEMAMRLEKAVGGTADTWLRMEAAFDISKVRERDAEIEVERLTSKVA